MRPPPRLAGLCLVSFLALTAGAQAPSPSPESAPAAPRAESAEKGVPVRLDERTLYYVREYLGPFGPRERADSAEKRLLRLAKDPFYSADLFTLVDSGDVTQVLYGETVVGVVSDGDARDAGTNRQELAASLLRIAVNAIAEYRGRRLPSARIRGWITVGVSTLLLAALFYALRRSHRRVAAWSEARPGGATAAWLQKQLAVRPEHVASIKRGGLRWIRIALEIVALVIYLEVAFASLPMTRGYALAVLDYVFDPVRGLWQGFLRNIGGLFTIAVLIVLTRYLLKGLRWILGHAAEGVVTLPGITREWAMPFYNILRIVVLASSAVMIYPYIPGSSTQAFKGISLFAGALFTLGATGTVGNFIGGLVVIFVGAFRLGDWVKVGDVTGEVIETSLVLTKIRTARNEVVSVPNAAILSGQLVNYSEKARDEGLILRTTVTIGYDAPWRTVHELLVRAAQRTSRIEKEPRPFVLQRELNDFYVTYDLLVFTREPKTMPFTYGELHQNIQDSFNEAGVEIMSPHYTSLRDGNTVTIPEAQRPAGYEAPRFRMRVEKPGDEKARDDG